MSVMAACYRQAYHSRLICRQRISLIQIDIKNPLWTDKKHDRTKFLTHNSIYVNKNTSIQLIISKKHIQVFPPNIKTNEVVSFRGKE